MCFNQPISGVFAASSFAIAYWAYKKHGVRTAIAIVYFGLMETLQFFQYFIVARPEDGYAKCSDPNNQFLTVIGLLHICFQPYFTSLSSARFRIYDIKSRYEKDLVSKLTLFGGFWLFSRYMFTIMYPDNPDMRPRATEACPNYEWIVEGYDPWLQRDTPNLPGHSCTFIPDSPTQHLAWAAPMYQASYFVPGASLHTFLMFVPGLFCAKWWGMLLLFTTGPFLAMVLTASLHEQAAVWCYFSILQCFLLVLVAPAMEPVIPKKLVYPGTLGEPTLEYELVESHSNGKGNGHSNGHSNGKKKN